MKKLQINCGRCDATELTEEKIAGYGAVQINCGSLLVTPSSLAVMARCGVRHNSGAVINVPEGARVVTKMGSFTLTAEDAAKGPTVLAVVGSLTVAPGAGAAAESYAGIIVNGKLICRRDDYTPRIEVTGTECLYPAGYEYVDDDLVIDKIFRLRFAGKSIYTPDTVTVGDPGELPALIEAGTRVLCGELAVTEDVLEDALKLAGAEKPEGLIVMPEGFVYLDRSQNLTKKLLRRGKKLWIGGNLTVERENMALLDELEGLRVAGRAVVPEELEARLEELDPDCGDIIPYRGKLSWGKEAVAVTRALLERHGFVTLYRCDSVTLDRALTPEEIEAGLSILRCDCVKCTPAQESAVRAVSEDVDDIAVRDPDAPKEEKPPITPDPDTVTVNTGMYKF